MFNIFHISQASHRRHHSPVTFHISHHTGFSSSLGCHPSLLPLLCHQSRPGGNSIWMKICWARQLKIRWNSIWIKIRWNSYPDENLSVEPGRRMLEHLWTRLNAISMKWNENLNHLLPSRTFTKTCESKCLLRSTRNRSSFDLVVFWPGVQEAPGCSLSYPALIFTRFSLSTP